MKIAGTHTVSAPREVIWRLLNDPEVLARATPGVQGMEVEGEDRYRATMQLGVGPVKGSFAGHIAVTDKREPESLTLALDGSGGPGGVKAVGHLRLEAQGERTVIHYEGEPRISGRLAAVGSRLLSGVAKKLAGQFFSNLEKEAQRRG